MQKIRELLLNERFILAVIFINAVAIFFQGFNFNPTILTNLIRFDNIITLIFVCEMIVKIKHFGRDGYFKDGWNRFDFILVILALPSLALWVVSGPFIDLDYLLVLRVARVFKFFRFLRFFPQIDSLVNGVREALKASVVVLMGFFVFIFIVSIISTFLFGELSLEHFGNPVRSFYSVFKVFTVEGWYEIPDQLAADVAPISRGYSIFITVFFAFILLIGGVFGLSIVNSIFVDAMVADNNDELIEKVESLEAKIDELLRERK